MTFTRLTAAPAYISLTAVSTDLGMRGRAGAGGTGHPGAGWYGAAGHCGRAAAGARVAASYGACATAWEAARFAASQGLDWSAVVAYVAIAKLMSCPDSAWYWRIASASGPGQNDVGDAATAGPSREIMEASAANAGRSAGFLARQAATISLNPDGILARLGWLLTTRYSTAGALPSPNAWMPAAA